MKQEIFNLDMRESKMRDQRFFRIVHHREINDPQTVNLAQDARSLLKDRDIANAQGLA